MYVSEFCSFWGFVLLMQRMMLSFCTGISFTPNFLGETASLMSTHGRNFHVREMTVEVGPFSGCPGCYLGNIRVCLQYIQCK